jgi:hypothetical protein
MVLIPNTTQDDFTYNILSNTDETLTVSGPINLAYVKAGDIFQIVSLKTGDKTIRLFSNTGTNSFADGDTTYDGICEGCHTLTDHFRNDGTGPDQNHTSQGPSIPGSDCTTCHAHDQGFQPAGDCVDCHGTGGPGIDVESEFGTAITDKNSHHISKAWADMGGQDCVACHGEGDPDPATAGAAIRNANHPAGAADGTVMMIDNSDSTRTTLISIDTADLAAKTGTAASDQSNFCMGCHRAGGAAAITAGNDFDVNHTSTNPFGETTNIRTNQYDDVQKSFSASLAVYEAFDTVESGDPDADGNRENHHAVRGARYSTSFLGIGGFLDTALTLWDGVNLDDDVQMNCADCHSVAFSAHGGNNEYMLQTAASENPAAEHANTSEYVCSKCHLEAGCYYGCGNSNHTTTESNMYYSADLDGTARAGANKHITGIACLNCHDGNVGFGGIHGFPDATWEAGEVGTGGGGTYNKRRFMPGSAIIGYDPSAANTSGDADWVMAVPDNECYTLKSSTAITSCTQHGMNSQSENFRNIPTRPVDY